MQFRKAALFLKFKYQLLIFFFQTEQLWRRPSEWRKNFIYTIYWTIFPFLAHCDHHQWPASLRRSLWVGIICQWSESRNSSDSFALLIFAVFGSFKVNINDVFLRMSSCGLIYTLQINLQKMQLQKCCRFDSKLHF